MSHHFSFILRMIDELYLPKFSISSDYSLEDILPQLGIREVFSTQADLSAITGAKDLRVSHVRQETEGGPKCGWLPPIGDVGLAHV